MEQNILRARWVLTWKELDPIASEAEGCQRKAKARLVILGYEDPDITTIPRDSPTLQRNLVLSCYNLAHRENGPFIVSTSEPLFYVDLVETTVNLV